MSFLKRLFGQTPDPLADWPEPPTQAPVLDLRESSVGPLRFGSSSMEARSLGRPARIGGNLASSAELVYPGAGFSLAYEEGKLFFATYYLNPAEFDAHHAGLSSARAVIITADGGHHEVHSETNAEGFVAIFGKPDSAELDEDESILEWTHGELTIEAELTAAGRAQRLNVFLTI